MPSLAPFLPALPARDDRPEPASPAVAAAAPVPAEPSSGMVQMPQTRSRWDHARAWVVRYSVVAIGWTLLGIYCAGVFSACRDR